MIFSVVPIGLVSRQPQRVVTYRAGEDVQSAESAKVGHGMAGSKRERLVNQRDIEAGRERQTTRRPLSEHASVRKADEGPADGGDRRNGHLPGFRSDKGCGDRTNQVIPSRFPIAPSSRKEVCDESGVFWPRPPCFRRSP